MSELVTIAIIMVLLALGCACLLIYVIGHIFKIFEDYRNRRR